ncbi:MAG: hypothetical protein DBX91_00875 [Subdoligranulum variabile]|uniref:hypothetical protein n=1 Tax=uncultured Subdoligranulum sp. TaxID=512298 RepID=UPI000D78EC05|nr:hypothetical protein [uncultured Subdoligranulum sp.]PWM63250.1 MAG: hypothetical protein DBX91_00875 [Subdoligranulum variabile]
MKKALRRAIINTMIYVGIDLAAWFGRPIPFLWFSVCTVVYYMGVLVILGLALRDFKRELSVLCPEIYRNWDQLLYGDLFMPRSKQLEVYAYMRQEMRKSPRKTEKTEDIVRGTEDWCVWGVGLGHWLVCVISMCVMGLNGKIG